MFCNELSAIDFGNYRISIVQDLRVSVSDCGAPVDDKTKLYLNFGVFVLFLIFFLLAVYWPDRRIIFLCGNNLGDVLMPGCHTPSKWEWKVLNLSSWCERQNKRTRCRNHRRICVDSVKWQHFSLSPTPFQSFPSQNQNNPLPLWAHTLKETLPQHAYWWQTKKHRNFGEFVLVLQTFLFLFSCLCAFMQANKWNE